MNLIPSRNEASLAYWCSWHTQNVVAAIRREELHSSENAASMKQGAEGACSARAMLNEDLLFGPDGYAYQFEDVRGDLYLMLDDGWDVDYGINPDKRPECFGSLEMSEERFPSVKGHSPAMRLKMINDRVKALGWKGIGIWVAAQRAAEDCDAPYGECDRDYWRERVLWCREAGVEYWKVDWGTQAGNVDFRRALTEIGRELYPALTIEHAVCIGPVNAHDHPDEALRGRYAGMGWVAELSKEIASESQVFRSYDVLNALAIPTTLDRVAFLLAHAPGFVNGEDECYLNAALGCHNGIMRSHYCQKVAIESEDSRGLRLGEATAALRWQRLAPAFAGTAIACSEEILFDDRFYHPGDSWWGGANGQTLVQGAPAVVARNLSVDSVRVRAETKPYVAVSLNPNGAYTVAVLPRVVAGKWHYPEAEIWCDIPAATDTVGVFGENADIHLNFTGRVKLVLAQSLLEDEAHELTEGITETSEGCTVTLTGEQIKRLFGAHDMSAPALVIRVLRE